MIEELWKTAPFYRTPCFYTVSYTHLLDSLKKRVVFLNEVIEKLHLNKITAVHARAEDAAKRKEYRECFDLCVSLSLIHILWVFTGLPELLCEASSR